MTPAQIADICDGRDKAIALWLSLYDTYQATRDEAARLTLGGALSLSCGRDWTEATLTRAFIQPQARREIGRASCRERVCPYVSISVVAVSFKKKIEYKNKET